MDIIGASRDGLSQPRNPDLVRAIHLPLFPRGLERLNQSGKEALDVGDLVIGAKVMLDHIACRLTRLGLHAVK